MLIDQASGKFECDKCGNTFDFTEMFGMGDVSHIRDYCYECFIKECKVFVDEHAARGNKIAEEVHVCYDYYDTWFSKPIAIFKSKADAIDFCESNGFICSTMEIE